MGALCNGREAIDWLFRFWYDVKPVLTCWGYFVIPLSAHCAIGVVPVSSYFLFSVPEYSIVFFRSWFPSHNRLISSIMDFNWNSESMAGGAWRHGTGGQETKWSSYQCAGFSNENDPWLLRNDPFLAPEPYESSLDWPELGPRKEALALADHSLYCRQADEMSVVPLRVLTRIAHL